MLLAVEGEAGSGNLVELLPELLAGGERVRRQRLEPWAEQPFGLGALERGDLSGAMSLRTTLRDPGSIALIDWLSIRLASRQVGFSRIEAFMRAHRDWPMRAMVRRRAEEALWLENVPPATVRSFFAANGQPQRGEGKIALARALLDAQFELLPLR